MNRSQFLNLIFARSAGQVILDLQLIEVGKGAKGTFTYEAHTMMQNPDSKASNKMTLRRFFLKVMGKQRHNMINFHQPVGSFKYNDPDIQHATNHLLDISQKNGGNQLTRRALQDHLAVFSDVLFNKSNEELIAIVPQEIQEEFEIELQHLVNNLSVMGKTDSKGNPYFHSGRIGQVKLIDNGIVSKDNAVLERMNAKYELGL